jgi:hypothetical protein
VAIAARMRVDVAAPEAGVIRTMWRCYREATAM